MNDDRLGPYRLLRRLGEGGMGVVHLAVDPQGRQVAVKVLRAEVTGDDVARRRLAREVETMRRVRSENIAEVLDADVTGHRPYIVTRYVQGQPLDDLVKQDGPLDLPALLRVAKGVASALAAVHSVGVIHRDLKPGNVLIMNGEPVLIDFGIAQAVDATRLTQTGMFIGTPGYLAPEIIEGQVAGPEVDVHAWAGTLLFACTGQPPFGKGTLEMIFYNITAGKANIEAAPPPLQPLLRAALQRDPAKRPTAAELAERVSALLPKPERRPPDEITTVPEIGAASRADADIPTPPVGPQRAQVLGRGTSTGPALGTGPRPGGPSGPDSGSDQAYVSLLGQQPVTPVTPVPATGQQATPLAPPAAPDEGDPWPTRRVTPEELRQARTAGELPVSGGFPPGLPGSLPGDGQGAQPWQGPGAAAVPSRPWDLPASGDGQAQSWDVPTQADASAAPSQALPAQSAAPSHSAPSAPSQSWDVPTQADPAAAPAPVRPEGDVPTQRVRPNDLPEYIRNYGQPGQQGYPGTSSYPHGGQAAPPYGQGAAGQATPAYGHAANQAPPARPQQGAQPPGRQAPGWPQQGGGYPPPYPPQAPPGGRPAEPYAGYAPHAPDQPAAHAHGGLAAGTQAPPGPQQPPALHPGQRPGQPLQRSKAYAVAAILLLVIMTAAAVLAPVLVAAVAIPVAVLLRAADIAQPQLAGQRAAGAAALDVVRVLGQPVALAKSIGITIALVPYALILGLPVTLLLTVLVQGMEAGTALSWGMAVALWTICAGPGVEGPSRQMRRTLASLLPSRNAAMGLAGVLAVLAAVAGLFVIGTRGVGGGSVVWSPIDVSPITDQLTVLHRKAAR
ncbi:serine/threonine protein kinase [Thermocatellispora tengchongensis]|uniref:Serine/threonine protein kinase n=2 Tax=Thermocatellispora tengchongensis TaxID=1073253 RepID=A0A840P9E5_9ACTN|nr:serine/threonine-protein kinase [Thermocatellispora tengchongensis]MBB5132615.1 serine/threonine protein kinase [Thermocatellispora tengchongensis]